MRALLLAWSVAWRAQVVHAVLFVLLPLLAATASFALGIVLMPFLLLGEGDRTVMLGTEARHLREPGCWVMLAPCSVADRTLFGLPWGGGEAMSAATTSPTEPEVEPFLPIPETFTLRHAWYFGWLAWLGVFLVRRERGGPAATPRRRPDRKD